MNDLEQRLAALAVRVGVGVLPGQDVVVLAWDVEQASLARAVADAAYRAGARFVSVLFWDQPVKHSRLRHAPVESLGFVPDWWEALTAECLERRSAVIGLWGEARRELFDDVAPERLASDHMPLTPALWEALSQGDIAWTLVPGPCPGIAKAMLGEADVDRLWDVLRPILRLDAAEPERAWRTHVARLQERAAILERHTFLALRFVAPERI